MGKQQPDFYEVLGVPRSATAKDIESAYRRLVRHTHPDVGGTNSLFHMVQEAYETLADPARRAAYDTSGSATAPDETPPPDSGWVRVDQPDAQTGEAYPPPPGPGGGTAPGHTGWEYVNQPGAATGGPYPQGAGQGPGWQPAPAARAGSELGNLVRKRPWTVPLAVGVFLFLVSGVFRGLGVLAFLSLLAGVIAALGSRRAMAGIALRGASAATIDAMDGTTFEHFCAEILRADGYHVTHVGQAGDFGADLILATQSGRTVVQVKRYYGNVGVQAVQQAVAARGHYGANQAIVLTNSYFTGPAQTLARSNAVLLWDRNELFSLASRARGVPAPSAPSLLLMQLWSGLLIITRPALSMVSSAGTGRRRW